MNKKAIGFIMTGLMAVGVGMAAQQPQAHAAGYKWVKTKNYKNIPWHNKSNKTAYMYNWNHTKKLHNLKNYPHTTWYVSKSIKMVKGNKSGVFYKVTSGNKKVSGYVYRGYLVKGKYQAPSKNDDDNFVSDNPYIKSSYVPVILDVFKGTKFDNAYAKWNEEYSYDNPIPDPRTPEQIKNSIYIFNVPDPQQIHDLTTKKLTFREFLLKYLKEHKIDPNAYQGYNIYADGYYPTPDEQTLPSAFTIVLYK
ncbi:hypothetical protein [Lentilactobacillus senioris]|uniref:hypothetical protein n=1 Tax=Lentilactobacillus senioris TaxID=931534 RepID=UPI003D26C571